MVFDCGKAQRNMTAGQSLEVLIAEATDWLLRLEEAPGDHAVRAAADAWRAADPAHDRAWVRAERAYRLIGRSVEPGRTAIGAPATKPPRGRRPVSRRWVAGAAAALAAGLLLLFMPGLLVKLRADFTTGIAELRQVTLEDGTVVELAAQSALDVRFSRERRSVTLVCGEAFFRVAEQPGRPFDVSAGDLTVTVVGTAFDVRLSPEATTVAVEHGAVEVRTAAAGAKAAMRLKAGDQLTVGRRDGSIRQATIAPQEVASWRDHRLFVEGSTVGQVVDELRRYNAGWIVFADAGFAKQQVTGLYDLGDPDRALRILVAPFGGQVREITPLLKIVSGP
jgi:transmembrane sensor